jgi:hypothetical protein
VVHDCWQEPSLTSTQTDPAGQSDMVVQVMEHIPPGKSPVDEVRQFEPLAQSC